MMRNEYNSFWEELIMAITDLFRRNHQTATISKGNRPRQPKGSFSNQGANAPVHTACPYETCNIEDTIKNKDVDFGDEKQSNDADSTEPVGEIIATAQTDDWGLKEDISPPPPTTVTTKDGDQENSLPSDSIQEEMAIHSPAKDSDRAQEETAVAQLAENHTSEAKDDEINIEKSNETSSRNQDNVDTGADQCSFLDSINEDATETALLKLKLKFMQELIEAEKHLEEYLETSGVDTEIQRMASSYIDNVMVLNGAKRIKNEKSFDPLRHQSNDGQDYPVGTKITQTIIPGIEIDDRILRCSIVSMGEEMN